MADAEWVRRATGGSPRRLVAALLLATFGAWAAFALAFVVVIPAMTQATFDAFLLIVLFYLTLLVPYAAVPGVAVGAGVHLMLVALKARGWAAYTVAGAVAGLALGVPSLPCPYGLRGIACIQGGWPAWLIFAAMPGLGAGLGFWAALRPDRFRAETAGSKP